MSVRNKTIFILCLTLAGLMIALYCSSRWILMAGFRRLETAQVDKSVERVHDALSYEAETLNSVTSDWAQWDDMYAFAHTRNPLFMQSNLVVSTFTGLRIAVMIITDSRGRILYDGMLDAPHARIVPVPAAFHRYLRDSHALKTLNRPGTHASGILSLSDGLWVISAQPIITSNGHGPVRGAVIVGRHLDDAFMERMNQVTHLDFLLVPARSSAMPDDCRRALARVNNQPVTVEDPLVVPRDARQIAGYARIPDIDARDDILLRVLMPRSIYRQGLVSIGYFVAWLLISGIVVGLVTVGLLERTVLRRLTQLHDRMEDIGETGDLAIRVEETGNDEIAGLGNSVNTMLVALEQAQQEEHERQQALRASEERFRYLFAVEPDALLLFETDTLLVVEVNDAALLLYGYTREEFLQLRITDLTTDPEDTVARINGAELGAVYRLPLRYHRNRTGQPVPVELAASLFEVQGRRLMYLAVRDITERLQVQDRVNYLAYYDELTSLPNRLLFTDRLEQALARAPRQHVGVAVFFIDLDRFKEINDTLGHIMGDNLLQQVSHRLSSCIRGSDTVARMGGDEFVLVLPDLQNARESAEAMAQRVQQAFSQPFTLDDQDYFVSASIGIALSPSDGASVETLMKHADLAMYRAKEAGRNRHQFFSSDMSAALSRRRQLEGQLRRALENEEFTLVYQPQVSLDSGQIFGVEALLRWRHPERGPISPLEFIPVAEESGLIEPIGEWVLREACAQARAWQTHGASDLRVAVNLSARQFERQTLVGTIEHILTETQLPPSLLELEITEGTAMRDWRRTEVVLQSLRASGIHIAIDDFGTGHCSFGYLQRFPVTTLKMDRTFIQSMQQNPSNSAIVNAIVVLCDALGVMLIAECVETEEQLAMLRLQGCSRFQGYYFSKPLTPEECAPLILGHRSLPSLVSARS